MDQEVDGRKEYKKEYKMESRIDCINIKKPNCEYYNESRLCPDDCKGFESINLVEQVKVNIEQIDVKNRK